VHGSLFGHVFRRLQVLDGPDSVFIVPPSELHEPSPQQSEVIAQFTRQAAVPWSKVPAITNSESLKLLVELSGATGDDTMLDVACGAGVVVCAFATVVRHATSIDLTPAMIERAGLLERETGLDNVSWQVGAAPATPTEFAGCSPKNWTLRGWALGLNGKAARFGSRIPSL
jgi:SAM-dependent methyltransferase